jgi:hypothetical protein
LVSRVRSRIVFMILLGLLGVFAIALVLRPRAPHTAPAQAAAAGPSASASTAPSGAGPAGSTAPGQSAGPSGAKPPGGLDRPLRVLGLGWDALAAGVLGNDGAEPGAKSEFHKAGIKLSLRAVDSMPDVESALARGGSDDAGTDVAVVPLPHLASSYERLRALDPVVFLVVGWSRGREIVVSKETSLAVPAGSAPITLRGAPADAATFLALFALDFAGSPPSRVKLVSEADAAFGAINRAEAPAQLTQGILLTSADASRLIPLAMVCQRSLVERHAPALVAFSKTWLGFVPRVQSDAADVARRIGELKNAPEPLSVLSRLGELDGSTLSENVELMGLSGRPPLTLDSLFQLSYRIWREAKVLTTPAPEQSPVDARVVAALARTSPGMLGSPAASPRPAAQNTAKQGKPLLSFEQRGPRVDEQQLVSTLALAAGAFPRSPLEVGVFTHGNHDQKATLAVIQRANERFELGAARVTAARRPAKPGVNARIDVLNLP